MIERSLLLMYAGSGQAEIVNRGEFVSNLKPEPMKYSLLFLLFLGSFFFLQCKKENQSQLLLGAVQQAPKHGAGSGNKFVINIPSPGQNKDIQPAIQAALALARSGDEIDLPEGTFSVRKTILVTKFISFRGAGISKTILYRPENMNDSVLSADSASCLFKFSINSVTSGNVVVSDMCLKSKVPCVNTGDGGSLAADIGIKFINCLDFVITRCHFENFGNAGVSIVHDDNTARGLICKNEFYHNVKGPDGLGLGYGVVVCGSNKQWVSDPRFGSDNFIFVEDNTFDFHRHAIAAGGCGLYVFRFNTVINNNIGPYAGQAIDAHEARQVPGTNYFSTRAVEIYNNQVINTTFKDGSAIAPGGSAKGLVENAILIRGGEALIHDNEIQGFRFGIGMMNFVVQGPQPYPMIAQTGYSSGLKYGKEHTGSDFNYGDGDLFAWNNQFTRYAGSDSSSQFYNYQPQYFLAERDFHLYAKPSYQSYIYPHPYSIY
jgi:hypothetical protein